MKPTIICHRGWWTHPREQNTLGAFSRALDRGWGIEVDVRDLNGSLVVSHDPPSYSPDHWVTGKNGPALLFVAVLELVGDRPNTIAVNIKSCGLAEMVSKLKAPKNWFFFDMATNDKKEYDKYGLKENDIPMVISMEVFGDPDVFVLSQWDDVKARKEPCYLLTDRPYEAELYFNT